jgi:hypothetical protein
MPRQSKNIRKKLELVVVSLCLSSVTMASVVLAQNVHLKGGANAEPTFRDNGLTLTAAAALAGLGGGDVLIDIATTGEGFGTCTNPGSGEQQPPGQNPVPVTGGGQLEIPEEEIKNGNVSFSLTTDRPTTPVPGAPECPNRRWRQDIVDIAFTSAVITVEQGGAVVLTLDCVFAEPTDGGAVPGNDVSCTEI